MISRSVTRLAALLALAAGAREARAQDAHRDETATRLRGFVDFTTTASSQRDRPSSFGIGQYVFFLTSALSEHVSFLGESVFEYDQQFIVDVERIVIAYSPNRYLRLAAGKHHTPIGYWNNAYHHGVLLQPTISRPQMFRFEDEGGVLPIHTTGVLVSGRDISPMHVGFDVMIGNGIGSSPTEDNDNAKSVTVALNSQVTSALSVGASIYRDRISAGSRGLGTEPLTQNVDQTMFGGYVAYSHDHVELLMESQHVANHGRLTSRTTGTDARYAYAGYRLGRLVPYGRYDVLTFAKGDPYFTPNDHRQVLLGARYDVAASVSTKVEIGRSTTSLAGAVRTFSMQVAVGF